MNNNVYLTKLHSDILVIMDEIDRICRDNNLHYYLTGGTLLGAIRHKGFIPWDDDLDIVMPRDDYEKFIEIFDNESQVDFYLEWHTTNKLYWLRFAKVCLKNTVFDEGFTKMVPPFGIFVDIFPLDYCDGYSPKISRMKSLILKVNAIAGSKVTKDDFKIIHWPRRILRHFISTTAINGICEKIAKSIRTASSSFYVNFGSQYSAKKQTMPISWYGEGIYLPFEDRRYCCPSEYKQILESIFGKNYMEIPPINKRRTHYPIHVKFVDGDDIFFEPTQDKIVIQE